MSKWLFRYGQFSRRRRRRAAQVHKRLDIQGLRMVAVLTVLANHLWHWPSGGFVGVDVFFVISGFLITGNLLRMADIKGNVSFRRFYVARAKRIVPAATVVLVLTFLIALLLYQPFRAREVGVDALFAWLFMSNWWFGYQGTDYFRAAADSVSPLQHYWSLSIEEQFYFVWPALIFIITAGAARLTWRRIQRTQAISVVMCVVVATSFGWALHESAASPTWAYFDTFSRAWELGIGALAATSVVVLGRIPAPIRPILSWVGLGLIALSMTVINERSIGFPAPWAILPVGGAVLVIWAGVGGEPRYQTFLRNPISGYIGDISYSLYLVHWPVIVVLGELMEPGIFFSIAVLSLTFGLAIASYHFIEGPFRQFDWRRRRNIVRKMRAGRMGRSYGYASVGALSLLVLAMVAYTARPGAFNQISLPPPAAASSDTGDPVDSTLQLGPLTIGLQQEITSALQSTEWPELSPPMDSVLSGGYFSSAVDRCRTDQPIPDPAVCNWGEASAPVRIVLVGDSTAMGYAGSLHDIAINSNGLIQVYNMARGACSFAADVFDYDPTPDLCADRNKYDIEYINSTKPSVVIVSNVLQRNRVVGALEDLTPAEWANSVRQMTDLLRNSGSKIVIFASPAGGIDIKDCYSKRSNTPPDCIGDTKGGAWNDMAYAEKRLSEDVGAVWIDSRPWFCSVKARLCPSFVGTTATKRDITHIASAYAEKIHPVIAEALTRAGVI